MVLGKPFVQRQGVGFPPIRPVSKVQYCPFVGDVGHVLAIGEIAWVGGIELSVR